MEHGLFFEIRARNDSLSLGGDWVELLVTDHTDAGWDTLLDLVDDVIAAEEQRGATQLHVT